MVENVTAIPNRMARLMVSLLALIAIGLAVLIVILLTGGDEDTRVTTGETTSVTGDVPPITGTPVDDSKPGDGSITVSPAGPSAQMTPEEVASEVERLWPTSSSASLWGVEAVEGWSCLAETDGDLVSGSVATSGRSHRTWRVSIRF